MKRRVVVTGIGVVSPLGLDARSTWDALVAGRSGIGPITKFDASAFTSRIAGEVRGFEPERFLDRKDVKKMDTFIHFAVAASKEALADAGLPIEPANADRVGVYIGSGIGGLRLLEDQHAELLQKGPRRISPFFIPGMIVNLAAGQVSILTGAKGPNLAVATACATGNHAIGEAMRLIREDYADAMIAGGTDAGVTPLAVGGFCAMKALSTRNDAPEKASRPFDAQRDGFVLGEGAARAMRLALKDASCEPREVDYINAHGTSTPVGDRIETIAVKSVFGAHAKELVFASTKSMTGHLLGAAGGLESAVTALAVHHGVIPPTINRDFPDPECDLDCAPEGARTARIRAALNNSFGFGGTNASLLFRRHEAP